MTITDIIPLRDNKYYSYCEHSNELKEPEDQITCLQKSVANLRKDLSHLIAETSRNKDRSFWIHGQYQSKCGQNDNN
jgi:septation ring formation regulator EzrA